MRRRRDNGQALLLVILALGIFLVGGLGLAIDGAQMYAHRQMAQNAADSAAQAGIMSIFNGTNTGANAFGDAAFTCATGTDPRTPCVYARSNHFGLEDSDTVLVEFPAGPEPGVNLSTMDPVNLVQVTVTRTLQTGLIRFLGPATSTIRARARAAIVDVLSPVPIIVLHPTMPGSFHKNGDNTIVICGGPDKSIQVNSTSTTAVDIDGNGEVDLSHAGPDASSPLACDGSGADFGNHGGPRPYPGVLYLGTSGDYVSPSSKIPDPLLSVPAPPKAGPNRSRTGDGTVPPGTGGCPAAYGANCVLFMPGVYPNGIEVKNMFALFQPGIYWIESGGFHLLANGVGQMAQAPYNSDPATGTGWTHNVMFFNTGSDVHNDFFQITANSGQIGGVPYGNKFEGSPFESIYKSILFFQDRSVATSIDHELYGGGGLELRGTIYLTHTEDAIMSDGTYQTLHLQGNAGSTTRIIGEIIVDALHLGGASDIVMTLDPNALLHVRQVALVR